MAQNTETAGEFVFGKAPSTQTDVLDTFNQDQKKLFGDLTSNLQSGDFSGALSLGGIESFINNAANSQFSDAAFDAQAAELTKQFQQDILPGISRNFSGGNSFFSSDRQLADSRAQDELISQLVGAKTGFLREDEQNRRQNQLGGLGLLLQGQTSQANLKLAPQQLLAQILGIQQQENVVTQFSGTEGAAAGFVGGVGQGAGAAAGAAAFSDKNLKENVEQIEDALAKVRSIDGVTWDWNDSGKKVVAGEGTPIDGVFAGILAQDVQRTMPELIHKDNNGWLKVNYTGLTGVLVEAVKELSEQVDNLREAA